MAKELAKLDIKSDSIYIFLAGGIRPKAFKNDNDFEDKYKIHFYDFGCITPSRKCLINYNWVVFNFLETKYGKVWRKEIRKDVIGLKEWKEQN